MEITPVNYLQITLFNTEEENEVKMMMDFVERAYKESSRAGLKNMFEQDREIIKRLMQGMNIKVKEEDFLVSAGDTHTQM